VRSFLLFVALFTTKHGAVALNESIDTVQPGLTAMILQQVGWHAALHCTLPCPALHAALHCTARCTAWDVPAISAGWSSVQQLLQCASCCCSPLPGSALATAVGVHSCLPQAQGTLAGHDAQLMCRRSRPPTRASLKALVLNQPPPPHVLTQVWLPSMGSVSGGQEEKLMAVATTRLLTEAPALQQPAAAELWGKLLAALVQYVDGSGSPGGWLGLGFCPWTRGVAGACVVARACAAVPGWLGVWGGHCCVYGLPPTLAATERLRLVWWDVY
jgi:hypothetical protein